MKAVHLLSKYLAKMIIKQYINKYNWGKLQKKLFKTKRR